MKLDEIEVFRGIDDCMSAYEKKRVTLELVHALTSSDDDAGDPFQLILEELSNWKVMDKAERRNMILKRLLIRLDKVYLFNDLKKTGFTVDDLGSLNSCEIRLLAVEINCNWREARNLVYQTRHLLKKDEEIFANALSFFRCLVETT